MVRDLLVSHRGMSRLEATTISNLSAKIFGVQAVVILRQQSKIVGMGNPLQNFSPDRRSF